MKLDPPTETEGPGIPTDLAAEALRQMVEDAGPTGAAEEDLRAAFDELQDIFINVVIWETWLRGMVTFGAKDGNLVLKAPRESA